MNEVSSPLGFSMIDSLCYSSWCGKSHQSGASAKNYFPLQVLCLWHHRHGSQPVAQIRSSADHIFWDSFFPMETEQPGKASRKCAALTPTALTPTLTYVWLFSSLTPASQRSSPSHLPLLSVFRCISSSRIPKSASGSPYRQSVPLNSWKISLDLFFLAAACLTYITGFDQHCQLDPSKSYRWVLQVKAKAFVYMLRASVCVCIIRVSSQMGILFPLYVRVWCLTLPCVFSFMWACVTVELWCFLKGCDVSRQRCLCNVQASQLHLTAFVSQ